MEFTISRELFAENLDKLAPVSRTGRKDYEGLGLISVVADKDGKRLILGISNGYIKAIQEVKDEDSLAIFNGGELVVDLELLRGIVKSAESDARIKFTKENKEDGTAILIREVIGQKRKVKIPVQHLMAALTKVEKVTSKKNFTLLKDVFVSSVKEILPYAGQEEYKPWYMLVYMEFRQSETRFVSTDGSKIGIIFNADETNKSKFSNADEHAGFIIPSPQAPILAALFEDASRIEGSFTTTTYYFKSDTGLEVLLEGIPKEHANFHPYETQLTRFSERQLSFEIDRNNLESVVGDMQAIRDVAWEKRHNCIPVTLKVSNDGLALESHFSRTLDCSMPVQNFKSYNGTSELVENYPLTVFGDVVRFGNSDNYEFSFIGKRDIVFCKFLDDSPERHRLVFFGPTTEVYNG